LHQALTVFALTGKSHKMLQSLHFAMRDDAKIEGLAVIASARSDCGATPTENGHMPVVTPVD
jgi:hypothetical protein